MHHGLPMIFSVEVQSGLGMVEDLWNGICRAQIEIFIQILSVQQFISEPKYDSASLGKYITQVSS